MENSVKLPPNFDIRAPSAATKWRFWKCLFEDDLVGRNQDETTDKAKLSLLRNMMGPGSMKVIMSFKMSKDDFKVYGKAVEATDAYVNSKYNEVFERYKFNERRQLDGESFENYYTCLRQLISNCDYDTSNEPLEDQLLRDRIVQGVQEKSLQESLLRMEAFTLDKVAKICRANELSRLQVQEMNHKLEIDRVKFNKNRFKKQGSNKENYNKKK